MKTILINGKKILLDNDDYEIYKDKILYIGNTGYVSYKKKSLAKLILNTEQRVQFLNTNKLDHQKSNLSFSVTNYYDKNFLYVLHNDSYIKVTLDKEDIERTKQYTWLVYDNRYIRAKILGRNTSLHRYLLRYDGDLTVDHINNDKYDNRKSNLRIVNITENNLNKGLDVRNTTGHKGISLTKFGYAVKFQKNGDRTYKTFSFREYSKEKALDEAIKYRQYLEENN